ncbi:calcium-responsive transactivator isoform X1 [Austrofundulus limnaeus]|uniref:Calcium-responsive transactivator isoform X1 n=1 Tax=Austrofundulus limnaeus TaxID=52670 RepID=A0A2I4DA74_AUSLI|nr:PREDICTED: calcium-responsive transactivator isoform X1 [Austrofundulus limnaeus]
MSVVFPSVRPRSKAEVTQQTIQKMLDENHHLIQCIMDYQSKGKTVECTQYQQVLHRNLVYLATIADSNQNMQSLLPAPPGSSMGPSGMSQSGGHATNNLNDNMTPGLQPTSVMQSQMSNGPSHAPMQSGHHQSAVPSSDSYGGSVSGYSHATPSSQGSLIQGPGPTYGSSSSSSSTPSSSSSSSSSRSNLNMQSSQVSMMHQQSAPPHYSSAQSGGQHYQGQQAMGVMGQGSQGNNMMSQRPVGSYRSSQQGSAQHYMGQDEFYGEQYGHTQSSNEPINQQYYADGHGEYAYQQSSYGEQGYDRSFEQSPQHYYEGGNSQYSQQQASYQQSSGQQQPFSQQQYSSQQGYSGQPQGYGPGQGGLSQFSQYQQGQNQQYGSYRSSQGGSGVQSQRSYAFEQGQYGNYPQ